MVVATPKQHLLSVVSRKKLGNPNFYGNSMFGWSFYGDDNEYAGIYYVARIRNKKVQKRINFYEYVITHTTIQTANRSKFADAVAAWQALPSDQKKRYNDLAVGMRMHGYGLFIKRFMLL